MSGTLTSVPLLYSGRVRRASTLAEAAHRGITRKSGDRPYFLHLVSVTYLLGRAGADDDLVIAGWLHDAVEDTGMSLAQIEDEFGRRVASLVAAVTKVTHDADGEKIAKAEQIRVTEERMANADADIAALKAADLTGNLTDIVLDSRQYGHRHLTQVFGSDEKAEVKLSHYVRLADILLGRLAYFTAYPVIAEQLRARADEVRQILAVWQADR